MSKRTKVRRTLRRKAKPSTALVRRVPAPGPIAPQLEERIVNDGIAVGALGLVELKLTAVEEKILSEPVDVSRIQWRPRVQDGPPEIPYLPHAEYTRWFNRAFGRIGWALVPVGKPGMTPNATNPERQTITCPYVLHVHGTPVAFAIGEQEYYEKNRQQTYGDALESTVASALRRCAKRLGVGLEMWDRAFLARLTKPYHNGQAPAKTVERDPPAAGYNPARGEKISEPQARRFWVIASNTGRDQREVKAWLQGLGYASSKDILRKDYDRLVAMVEAPAPLR